MFPIAIIAGVIGAVVSGAQGASWLSKQVDSTNGAASVGGKGEAQPQTDAKAAPFAAALAGQVAGQSVPASPAVAPVSSSMLPSQYGTDYDALARMKAGFVAYNHIGEHRGNHTKQPPEVGDAGPIMRS